MKTKTKIKNKIDPKSLGLDNICLQRMDVMEELIKRCIRMYVKIILTLLIALGILFIGVALAFIFEGDYLLLRSVIIFPFTSVAFVGTRMIWSKF